MGSAKNPDQSKKLQKQVQKQEAKQSRDDGKHEDPLTLSQEGKALGASQGTIDAARLVKAKNPNYRNRDALGLSHSQRRGAYPVSFRSSSSSASQLQQQSTSNSTSSSSSSSSLSSSQSQSNSQSQQQPGCQGCINCPCQNCVDHYAPLYRKNLA